MNKYLFKRKKELFLCFVDFLKVFDIVWRLVFLYKILKKGIGGNFFNIIKYMYFIIKCVVRQGNLCSNFFNIILGVKQGDNLSFILFNIFVDDFENYFDKVVIYFVFLGDIIFNYLFFVDDFVLLLELVEGF